MSEPTIAGRRLHPATVWLNFLKTLPQNVIGLPAILGVVSDIGWARVIGIAAVAAVLMVLVNWIAWRRFRFGVGAHEIVIEKGVFSRTRRTIPFDRIHDVDIERGPLERLFGLAKVRIETGGAAKDEGTLDSLSLADANALRSAVRAAQTGTLPPATEAGADASPLFTMPVGRVILAGLFNFSLVYLAGLFGLLQAFDDWLPFDLYDWGRWTGLAENRLAGRFTPGMIAAALLLALLVGAVMGVARTLGRDFGFRLTAEPRGFRRERGLFTRTEIVIPKRRIQLALQDAGIVRRALGWRSLSFQTLGSDGGGSGHQSAAPLAREDELRAILAETGAFELPAADALEPVSQRHVLKAVLGIVLIPLPAIVAASLFFPLALLLLAALPLLVAGAVLERRAHRYALIGELLFVQRGFVGRRLWIVPVRNAQTITLRRSWLQRRLGLATLLIDTAGASAFSDVRIVDLKAEVAEGLAEAIAGRNRRSRNR